MICRYCGREIADDAITAKYGACYGVCEQCNSDLTHNVRIDLAPVNDCYTGDYYGSACEGCNRDCEYDCPLDTFTESEVIYSRK